MHKWNVLKLSFNTFILLLMLLFPVSAAYVEGIDTTDFNGYGMDSSFKVESNRIRGAKVIYGFIFGHEGYFDHSFDEIKKVPETIQYTRTQDQTEAPDAHCFIAFNTKDSTYAKVRIISRLSNGRYVYRYGKNTTPNDKLLEKDGYDRSKLYKPNNFHQSFLYRTNDPIPEFIQKNTFTWEPPLPNNNRLLGYILYIANVMNIDTTVPINYSQWNKAVFTASTVYENTGQYGAYLNLVAVYENDTTDFLAGWSRKTDFVIHVAESAGFSRRHGSEAIAGEQDRYPQGWLSENLFYALDGRALNLPRSVFSRAGHQSAAGGVYIMRYSDNTTFIFTLPGTSKKNLSR